MVEAIFNGVIGSLIAAAIVELVKRIVAGAAYVKCGLKLGHVHQIRVILK